MADRPLFPAGRQHLDQLTGPFGIWQHARGVVADKNFGACTDDVARALAVDLLQVPELGWEVVAPAARRSMAFLVAAFDPSTTRFRNFRGADGAWLDAGGSQDCQGRALLALGNASLAAPDHAMRAEAQRLLTAALPRARRLTSPRAVASATLGFDAAVAGGMVGDTELVFAQLVGRLRGVFSRVDLDGDWPWPEEILTYENALLPHALIVAGRRLTDPRLRSVGLTVLDWLIEIQTSRRGTFSPIGNAGWWPHEGTRSHFDQQPIEATALILAAAAAYEQTHDAAYCRAAEAAYGWFLGGNDAGLVVADVQNGGCHDGLSEDKVNVNQGAESTLMWLTALEAIRSLRTRAMSVRSGQTHGRAPILVELRA